ncbi:hypothetical protein F4678DRAFT_418835 [Xylaria arbuscula]|nr:hypothetical protein F4678DRAFT_418835 [Xylaria arbuscula]
MDNRRPEHLLQYIPGRWSACPSLDAMPPTSQASAEAKDIVTTDGRFRFVTIQGPDEPKDRAMRRLARSHAVKQALENKRKIQQEARDNFRVMTPQDQSGRLARKRTHAITITVSPYSLSASMLDPFQSLAENSSRLQTLLGDYEARQSLEPVFNIADQATFQSFQSVFQTGLVDPALMSAVMHSLAFAAARGDTNRECLGYQGRTFSYVREKMNSLSAAASESTIGAILLLAGVEARLGRTAQVQLHLGAVRQLLDVCEAKDISLTGGIKRAIFWQDHNAFILAGSSRIVDYKTFPELHWARESLPRSYYRLPPGFQAMPQLLTKDFIEVLTDLHALQCHRDLTPSSSCAVGMMQVINNHSASIQCRLTSLPKLSPVQTCYSLAAYLCSVMLCCKVWCAPLIPHRISSQLLKELQRTNEDPVWESHPELLLWPLYIGGAYAPQGVIRREYVALLRSNNASRFKDLYKSWPELLDIMRQFIWSDKAFTSPVKAVWEEALA